MREQQLDPANEPKPILPALEIEADPGGIDAGPGLDDFFGFRAFAAWSTEGSQDPGLTLRGRKDMNEAAKMLSREYYCAALGLPADPTLKLFCGPHRSGLHLLLFSKPFRAQSPSDLWSLSSLTGLECGSAVAQGLGLRAIVKKNLSELDTVRREADGKEKKRRRPPMGLTAAEMAVQFPLCDAGGLAKEGRWDEGDAIEGARGAMRRVELLVSWLTSRGLATEMDAHGSEGICIVVVPGELAPLLAKSFLGTVTACTLRHTSTTAFRYERSIADDYRDPVTIECLWLNRLDHLFLKAGTEIGRAISRGVEGPAAMTVQGGAKSPPLGKRLKALSRL